MILEYKSAKAEIGKIPNCESVLKVPKHLWCLLNCASNDHPMFLKGNFPDNCIAELATHYVAIKNGAILDSWDCRGKRPRKLIGYWSKC